MASDPLKFAAQRMADITQLSVEFGLKKLNLVRSDSTFREGIWCVPVTEVDNRKMLDDDSVGEHFRAYLLNMPLPWGHRCWGAEVIGVTRGSSRPEALPEDQASLDVEVKLLYDGLKLLPPPGHA